MEIDTRCCMCNRLEDGGHLLLKCKEVKHVWRELNLETVRIKLSEAGSPIQMMELEENQKLSFFERNGRSSALALVGRTK